MAVRLSFARIPLYLLYALAVYLLTALPAAIGAAFVPGRSKRIVMAIWLLGMAAAPLLGYGGYWNFNLFVDAVLPVALLLKNRLNSPSFWLNSVPTRLALLKPFVKSPVWV